MPVDKPTERAAEALGAAQSLAESRGNQLVEPEHLLLALLDQPEGVVQPIVERAGANPAALRAAAQAAVEARQRADKTADRVGNDAISKSLILFNILVGVDQQFIDLRGEAIDDVLRH